eukprot:CAMPEP_0194147194 /NCGR_PEP_ID=MMETSP0152-20130528/22576_1 /TAXON_ID=1049557 /ORGANISM="Thalassiothrix antarctica, Strain L6-D1" /LENGTH=365 /DNA_ID=CAMNT_0038847905 /DNA_START=57 /DNA_END=1154 /DNA_ORIENTATION=+
MASGGPDEQWAWLGLLKWSLSHSDGTRPSSETLQMTDEDKKFLEEVMKNGIIDENERMKYILEQMTNAMEEFKKNGSSSSNTIEELEELLFELNDIVENIDYARAFCFLKGLPFLLGCCQQREKVPDSIRIACLGILSTVCQNNPPVQLQLLELSSLRTLSEMFFVETRDDFKAKIVQAISANVRNHTTAETIFCETEQATELIAQGLGVGSSCNNEEEEVPTEKLRKKTVFFLRALITSDSSDRTRVRKFEASTGYIADNFLDDDNNNSSEIGEMSLQYLNRILEQKFSVNALLTRKNSIVALGIRRIATLRNLEGEEKEYAAIQLEEWETLIRQLSRITPDEEEEQQPILMIGASPIPTALPQ